MKRALPSIAPEPDALDRRRFLHNCLAGALTVGFGLTLARRAAAEPVEFSWTDALWQDGDQMAFPIPAADGVTVDRKNELILVRESGQLFAFALSCPHQRSMLKWREKDGRFQCTKHGSKYQPNGEFVEGRATRGMDRYPVQVRDGQLWVDTSRKIQQDEDGPGWTAAVAPVG
ncbi:MAG: Rieske (2Fe-2S) protein [Gemmatimonadota bacterium]